MELIITELGGETMGAIIKAAQVLMSGARLLDLTQPGSDRTREARQAAMDAGAVIAGKAPMYRLDGTLSLAEYRAWRNGSGERGPAA